MYLHVLPKQAKIEMAKGHYWEVCVGLKLRLSYYVMIQHRVSEICCLWQQFDLTWAEAVTAD